MGRYVIRFGEGTDEVDVHGWDDDAARAFLKAVHEGKVYLYRIDVSEKRISVEEPLP
jgi:hypothetical protein